MPGSQKFSLRLPSRKNKTQSEGRRSSNASHDVSYTASLGQGKIDRILGTNPNPKKLSAKPSLVSITVSEVTNDTRAGSVAPGHRLQPRPSSPLLGDKYLSSSVSSVKDKSLRGYGSSSTLYSYYDAQKLPTAISQQTSESSARDFAMRKGQHIQTDPQREDSRIPENPSPRGVSIGISPAAASSSSSSERIRHRPNNIDLSMLFPNQRSNSGPMLSPQRYTSSPSPLSTTGSDSQGMISPAPSHGIAQRLSKNPPPTKGKKQEQPLPIRRTNTAPDPLLTKVNVRRPKPGIQNWFDGLEDLSEEEDDDEDQIQAPAPPSHPRPAQRTAELPNRSRFSTSRNERTSLLRNNSKSSDAGTIPVVLDLPGQNRYFRNCIPVQAPPPPQTPQYVVKSPASSQAFEDETNQSVRSQVFSTKSKHSYTSNSFAAANLKNDSILALSSSSEDEDSESDYDEPLRSPILRDSLLINSYRELETEVEVGTAQIAKAPLGSPVTTSHRPSLLPKVTRISQFGDLTAALNKATNSTSNVNSSSNSNSNSNSKTPSTTALVSQPSIPERQSSRISGFQSLESHFGPRSSSIAPAQQGNDQFESHFSPRSSVTTTQQNHDQLDSQFSPRSSISTAQQSNDQRASTLTTTTTSTFEERSFPTTRVRQNSVGYDSNLDRRPSTRMMRVTRQEESLLAAMRLKKANMKRAILTEAYNTAVEEEEEAAIALDSAITQRPRTSGDQSHIGLDKMDALALPRPRSAEGRQSLGPEDFALLGTALAPPSAPPSSHYHSQSDAASSSRRGSIIPSESIPSPSTSRASPVTPTISHLPVRMPSGKMPDLYTQPFPLAPSSEDEQIVHRPRSTTQTTRSRGDSQVLPSSERNFRQLSHDQPPVPHLPQHRPKQPSLHDNPRLRSILDDLDDAAEEAVNLDDFPLWASNWGSERPIGGVNGVTVVP